MNTSMLAVAFTFGVAGALLAGVFDLTEYGSAIAVVQIAESRSLDETQYCLSSVAPGHDLSPFVHSTPHLCLV
jgi:hypothetical protein